MKLLERFPFRVFTSKVWVIILVILTCTVVFFPFYWMVVTSLKKTEHLFAYPPTFIPLVPNLISYIEIFQVRPLATWLGNSFVVASLTTLFSVAVASFGAYGFSRFRFRGKNLLAYLLLATQMLPGVLIIVPIYMIFRNWNLTDELAGLILVYMSFNIPIAMWILRGFFDSIPPELEEAAMVDGCSRMGSFLRIIFPLSAPGLVGTATVVFIMSWNEYLYARTLISTQSKWTVSVGLSSFIGEYITPWDQIMAGATVTTLPILILFLIFQRYLVRGLTAGAVKG